MLEVSIVVVEALLLFFWMVGDGCSLVVRERLEDPFLVESVSPTSDVVVPEVVVTLVSESRLPRRDLERAGLSFVAVTSDLTLERPLNSSSMVSIDFAPDCEGKRAPDEETDVDDEGVELRGPDPRSPLVFNPEGRWLTFLLSSSSLESSVSV